MFSQPLRAVVLNAPANTQLNPVESRTLSFDLAGAASSASRSRPRKKCQDCSGRPAPIAEIKMVRSRIIKIHRAFDETQTENPDIKIEIPLWIAGDCSDVMKSRDFTVHQAEDDVRSNSPRRFGVKRTLARSDRALVRPY